MTDSFTPSSNEPAEPTVFRDRRRIDPETGKVRAPQGESQTPDPEDEAPVAPLDGPADDVDPASAPVEADPDADPDGVGGSPSGDDSLMAEAAEALAAERLVDLQRLQAEYVNYRRRVERDQAATRELAVAAVLEQLLPVLDDIGLARQHGDLGEGPFAAIAGKLEAATSRLGLESYGAAGEEFDPAVHEAFMASTDESMAAGSPSVVNQVLQPGYRMTGASARTLRPARVAVASPA